MSDIKLSLNSIKDLEAIDLVDKFTENNEFTSGKIKLNGKTYNITFINNEGKNSLKVEREFKGLFGAFRNKHCNRLTSHAVDLMAKLKQTLESKEFALIRNNYYKLLDLAQKDKSERTQIELADYGLKSNRNLVKSQNVIKAVNSKLESMNIDKVIRFNRIDNYNTLSGITPLALNINQYANTMNKIANRKLAIDPKLFKKFDHTVSEPQLKKYFNFISRPENVDKFNIPKKLYGYLHQTEAFNPADKQTGWKADFKRNPDQALRNFMIKNVSPTYKKDAEKYIEKTLPLFKEYIEIFNIKDEKERNTKLNEFLSPEKWLSEKGLQVRRENIEKYADAYGMSFEDAEKEYNNKYSLVKESHTFSFLSNIICYATFRQTSKLGLEFFRENNVPVLFQYADRSHKDLKGDEYQAIKNEHFWKEGELKKDVGGSIITNSELRKLGRMKNKYGEDFNLQLVHGSR